MHKRCQLHVLEDLHTHAIDLRCKVAQLLILMALIKTCINYDSDGLKPFMIMNLTQQHDFDFDFD